MTSKTEPDNFDADIVDVFGMIRESGVVEGDPDTDEYAENAVSVFKHLFGKAEAMGAANRLREYAESLLPTDPLRKDIELVLRAGGYTND